MNNPLRVIVAAVLLLAVPFSAHTAEVATTAVPAAKGAPATSAMAAANAAPAAFAMPAANAAPAQTLTSFRSEKELKEFLKRFPPRRRLDAPSYLFGNALATSRYGVIATGAASAESITNTQHAGVNEGGIVKLHGPYLVVLRRGRLFTIDVSEGRLQPVSSVNAFGPEVDPDGAWYDELLVSGSKVVVIGYSYLREGTELGIFDIDAAGRLKYRATHQIRSNDYYSTRNYASRLIGDKLILYSPLEMPTVEGDTIHGLPGMRKWQDVIARRGSTANRFVNIATPSSLYYMPSEPQAAQVLHTVTTCDLSAPELSCKATALSGNWSKVFYVSPKAVYLWTGGWIGDIASDGTSTRVPGTLFRMPLDGSAPQAVGVRGTPVDQLSFEESDAGFLDVVTRAQSGGEWMGSSGFAKGDVELLHLPLTSFGDGTGAAPVSAYRRLPEPPAGAFHSRFVGGSLLYGSSDPYGEVAEDRDSRLFITDPESGLTSQLRLPHGVDRIEVMGRDAVVVGNRGEDLHFSGVRLGSAPMRVQYYVMRNAAEGEARTHGFFYKPADAAAGVLALPVRTPRGRNDQGLTDESAAIVFLRNQAGRFDPIGALHSGSQSVGEDRCKTSCADWYGNARPIFVGNRILAMMGYEVIEGRIDSGTMREVRRASFAPRAQQAAR